MDVISAVLLVEEVALRYDLSNLLWVPIRVNPSHQADYLKSFESTFGIKRRKTVELTR